MEVRELVQKIRITMNVAAFALSTDEAERLIDLLIEERVKPWNEVVERLVFALEEAIKFGLIKTDIDANTGCGDDIPNLAAYLSKRENSNREERV